MKKFIISILSVSVFFIGLGGLVEQAGAKFKSDERALTLIRQARIAIGGDANINAVRSLSAKGKATHIFKFNGTDKSGEGDFEINLALPNQFSKMVKLRTETHGAEGAKNIVEENNNIVIVKKGEDKVFFRTDVNNDADKHFETAVDDKAVKKEFRLLKNGGDSRGDELARTMLSLFLTAPEGADVEYFYAGSGNVDGNDCEIVEAKKGTNSIAKIYLSKSNNLPLMMSYQGVQIPRVVRMHKDDARPANTNEKDVKVFVSKLNAPATAEINVKFSDYRTVNGLQLPFVWTQTANGEQEETIKIDTYEINPPDIAERFNKIPQRTFVRSKIKPQ